MRITKELYNKIITLYPKWQFLNTELKKIYSRGINLHEAFTEIICCYHLNLDLNLGKSTNSADAFNQKKEPVQIKGSSYCEDDLSSFGPNSKFNILYYCCIDTKNVYIMNIFNIPINNLNTTFVNKNETFFDQQRQKRRPRFSIYKKIILPNQLKPLLIINLKKTII